MTMSDKKLHGNKPKGAECEVNVLTFLYVKKIKETF